MPLVQDASFCQVATRSRRWRSRPRRARKSRSNWKAPAFSFDACFVNPIAAHLGDTGSCLYNYWARNRLLGDTPTLWPTAIPGEAEGRTFRTTAVPGVGGAQPYTSRGAVEQEARVRGVLRAVLLPSLRHPRNCRRHPARTEPLGLSPGSVAADYGS